MGTLTLIGIVIVALLAGVESVMDEFEFHQPILACTLIGIVAGDPVPCIILGGTLQMIALGWANIGAAVAPDAAFASVASAIILVQGGQGIAGIPTAIGIAIPLAVAGLFTTMIVRTLSVPVVHFMDGAAEKGSFSAIEFWQIIAVLMQGARIAIPAVALCFVPAESVQAGLQAIPGWLTTGMAIGGGMVVAVGYAMVINMIANKETWAFLILGFCVAALTEITLISLGAIAMAMVMIYLRLSDNSGSNNSSNGGSKDPIGDILDDY
ncbi:MAG: PTS mannose/fructose/sorbose transporter subunit IIC [Anaerovibrio sp.]|nr:PTS mannose/fructose/sorbose transporter subunit IIC [Anaerovibrio sp.]